MEIRQHLCHMIIVLLVDQMIIEMECKILDRSYKYYLDENATATQIGDVHIGTSVEYRLKLNGLFQTTLFADAGNIWTNI